MNRKERLLARIAEREAQIGIVGLGYVGLPLAVAFAQESLAAPALIDFSMGTSAAGEVQP